MIPTTPGMAPGTHWRAPGNPRLARLYNQTDALDDILGGNVQGVHHGAFGGRSVQIPGGQYRVHPMAVNSAPMAPMSRPAGDPGLWFNQTPQPFDANAYVDGNSQRINAGQMRAVANMRDDGGVQLRGGGRFMDPVAAARAFINMGGKGLTFNNGGQPMMNGNVMDGQGMFQANMDLRKSMASSREGNIRNNRRVNRALFRAQHYGDMGPLWKAVGDGLVKMPDQGQGNAANQNRGADFMMNAALDMFKDMPPHQATAMLGPMARALASGNIDDLDAVTRNMGNAQARRAAVARKAEGVATTVQPGDILEARRFSTGDEALDAFLSQGRHKNRSIAAVKKAFPDWNPRWAGMFDYTDADTGEVNSYLNHPAVEDFTGPGQMRSVYDMFFGKWPGDGPKKPAQQGSWQQMPQVGPVDPNGLQPIPNAPLGPSPPGAMSPMNAPGNWLEKLGHRFLNQRW